MPTAFVTGATGFIGRRFVAQVQAPWTIRALSRQAQDDAQAHSAWVEGRLEEPDSYADALTGADVVVHLGALTGKAPPSAFEAVNLEATRQLVEATQKAGVGRFVFVSTIAVRYPEHANYPYGRTKKDAEAVVEQSDLRWTIVRPTIVLGPGSPILTSLAKLAGLPVTPLFGSGQTRIQPILADDVARALWAVVNDDSTVGKSIDLGGPDVVTFDDFMRKLRERKGRGPGPLVHLPAGLTSTALALAEPAFRPLMPVTAGQLYAFRYDSTADDSEFGQRHGASFAGLDAQLEASFSDV